MPLPYKKTVLIEIDASSWSPSQAPPQLESAAAGGPYNVDLVAALVFIGIWTRPPTRPGFTLADCWAWLRYFPAFAPSVPLQFCEEWLYVDSHQKTVASDELGVGLTTWALHRTLGFQRFADTNWVMNVLAPRQWRHRTRPSRGPAKAPDYIAEDSQGGLSVLECKGTQSSIAALRRAVARGRPQKSNVAPQGSNVLIHSLVAGAFVPQWNNSEPATLLVVDPEWEDVTNELRKYGIEDIRSSTQQVAYAKELAVFDLAEAAGALVHATEEHVSPAYALDRDIALRRSTGAVAGNALTFVREHFWRTPLKWDEEEYVGVRFRGQLNLDLLEPIRRPSAQVDARESIAEATANVDWQDSRIDQGARLISPIGAEYTVEWLPRS